MWRYREISRKWRRDALTWEDSTCLWTNLWRSRLGRGAGGRCEVERQTVPPLKASHPGSPLTRPQTRSPDNTGGCKKTTNNNRTSTRRCRSLLGTAAASDNQRKFESLTYVLWILKITITTTSSSRASLEFSLTCVPQQRRHNHHNWPGCSQII
jgi:hypothetical protein